MTLTTFKKLIVVGHGGHGKDVFASMLADYWPLAVASSSHFVAMRAVWPILGGDYDDFDSFYADRRNRRVEWTKLIREYNTPDLCRLGRELFALHDVYVGPRNRDEYMAMKAAKLFDYSVWVDASERLPETPEMEIRSTDCEDFIDNNGPLKRLKPQVIALGTHLYGPPPERIG
jgi:hypothetical protein